MSEPADDQAWAVHLLKLAAARWLDKEPSGTDNSAPFMRAAQDAFFEVVDQR